MHGLGNDFVVLDNRDGSFSLNLEQARTIADRRLGVGCDQLLIMKPATSEGADVFMEIRNTDGSEAEACGNGTRCVAAHLMDESGNDAINIQTVAGILPAVRHTAGMVSVDMGPANLGWSDIPLASKVDTLNVDVTAGPLSDAVAVNMGNPHAVFFVDDAEAVDVDKWGAELEHDPMFPERANIEVVSAIGPDRFRMRVWERSVGITRACGSGACAVGVAAHRRGMAGRKTEIVLDGGSLFIEWRESDGHVLMAGPTARVYDGVFDSSVISV